MVALGLLILRVVIGLILAAHGAQKLFGWFGGPGAYSLDAAFGIRFPEPVSVIVVTILVIAGVAVALLTRAPQPVAENTPQVT